MFTLVSFLLCKEFILSYLFLGFLFYILFKLSNIEDDIIVYKEWKKIYRILFRFSIILFWIVYVVAMILIIIFSIVCSLVKLLIGIFE